MSGTLTPASGARVPPLAQQQSWTDDLPVCCNSGVGYETNKAYRRDGYRTEEHAPEDFSFHFELDAQLCLYAVVDGYRGPAAARFAQQRLPAELCFGQLKRDGVSEQSVRAAVVQAFDAVEKGYFETIDGALAERAMLMSEIPAGLSEFEAQRDFPTAVQRLALINAEVGSGTTAVLAVVHADRLHVANVGDSRALLCTTDGDGGLQVLQLSAEHRLHNGLERQRLARLGVTVPADRPTRCLGDYALKTSAGVCQAQLAEPDVSSVALDASCRFLLLVSRGLCHALQEVRQQQHINVELAQMVVEQFGTQTTLEGVAQSVVNRVARDHHDCFINSQNQRCLRCEDMTLLVRNFSYPLRSSADVVFTTGTSTSSTNSSEPVASPYHMSLDANHCIRPYISFQEYHNAAHSDHSWWKRLLNM